MEVVCLRDIFRIGLKRFLCEETLSDQSFQGKSTFTRKGLEPTSNRQEPDYRGNSQKESISQLFRSPAMSVTNNPQSDLVTH